MVLESKCTARCDVKERGGCPLSGCNCNLPLSRSIGTSRWMQRELSLGCSKTNKSSERPNCCVPTHGHGKSVCSGSLPCCFAVPSDKLLRCLCAGTCTSSIALLTLHIGTGILVLPDDLYSTWPLCCPTLFWLSGKLLWVWEWWCGVTTIRESNCLGLWNPGDF